MPGNIQWRLDGTLDDLIWLKVSLCTAGGLDYLMVFK